MDIEPTIIVEPNGNEANYSINDDGQSAEDQTLLGEAPKDK